VPDWSAFARAKIDGKELRFLSPDFAYDKKTKEILEIYRISLVAEPGTWRARMVANANRKKGRLTMAISAEMIAAITEMAALMEAEKVSDALKGAINKVVALSAGGEPEVVVDDPDKGPIDLMKPDAIVQKNTTLARRYSVEAATLAARRVCTEKILTARGELNLKAAEEVELAKIGLPDELDRALGLLKASRDGQRVVATLGREPAKDAPAKLAPTGNQYLDALASYGIGGAS
jgi:hypothetical protein